MKSAISLILQPNNVYLNKFKIDAFLGQGHFGQVYKVTNIAVGRAAALKLIRVIDPTTHKAIIEAQAQNLCSHDSVTRIFGADIITTNGSTFVLIEMEFIPEGSLEDRQKREFVPIRDSISYIKDALFALQHAHVNSIVHRDVKPGNILLSRPRAKLSDFGVALHQPTNLSPLVDAFYRPHTPPEGITSNIFDASTDIYATGVTLFRAVCNISDWRATTQALPNLEHSLETGTLMEDIGFAPFVPGRIKTAIRKACSFDPASRYRTATEFRHALERLSVDRAWVKIAPEEWHAVDKGIHERATLSSGRNISVEFTRNGRRVNARCRSFDRSKDAYAYLHKTIANTTLS